MTTPPAFELNEFLPYLLNQAADQLSRDFQTTYKDRYGMLRTEWRVLFHLGCYGDMTAKTICDLARLHKTKVSRAVAALEEKRYLSRSEVPEDRRNSTLTLTREGRRVFQDLSEAARAFEAEVRDRLTKDEAETLHRALLKLAQLQAPARKA